jgi:hypothetical protein
MSQLIERKRTCWRGFLSIAMLSLLAVGCSGSTRQEVAHVGGIVTFGGKGVGGVAVMFSPLDSNGSRSGKSAIGITAADGSFRLTTYEADDGAGIGKHRVEFTTHDPNGKLPGRYRGPKEVEVKPDENVFNFKLE